MTRLHLRLDSVTPGHIVETVFVDGHNCGVLTLDHGQYQLIGAALALGAERTLGNLVVEFDPIGLNAEGRFCHPDDPRCISTIPDRRS